jgi:hypothetical protein
MRKTLILVVVAGVVAAALGATVLREPIAQAASPFTNVIVGNTSTNPVPVTEQNLDGNGNVRVHEQGVAAVHEQGTVSVSIANGNLPVSGTVNVGNSSIRVMHEASNLSIPKNTAANFGFQDTSDCKAMAAFIKPGGLNLDDGDVFLRLSVTGTTIGDQQGGTDGVRRGNVWYFSSSNGVPFFAPKAELVVVNGDEDNAQTLDDAWLVCQR